MMSRLFIDMLVVIMTIQEVNTKNVLLYEIGECGEEWKMCKRLIAVLEEISAGRPVRPRFILKY